VGTLPAAATVLTASRDPPLEASLVPARVASAAIAKTKVRVRLMIVLLLPGY
jgi:hypothetical protein